MKRTLTLAALLAMAPLAMAQQPAPAPPAAVPAPATAQPAVAEEPAEPHVTPLGFTWWNDIPEMIRRGNEALQNGDTATSTEYYRNAQLKNPDEPVAAFNHGLARAKQGDMAAAMENLRNAIDLAPKNRDLRNRAYYNMGVGQFEMAKAAEKAKKRDDAIRGALDAIESLDSAVREGGPEASKAEDLKKQAQHFLQQFATPPPQQQQQQKSDKQNNEDKKDQQQQQQSQTGDQQKQDQQQKNEEQQQQQQQQLQQQQDQQNQENKQQQDSQQQSQDQQNQDQAGGEKKDQEKKEEQKEQEGKDEKKEEKEGGKEEKETAADKMTEEQARQMLNLVEDNKNVRLRKGGRSKQDNDKDW